jgi:hypothetical protein
MMYILCFVPLGFLIVDSGFFLSRRVVAVHFYEQMAGVETCDSLLMFSSKVLDLGLEQEVVDVEGNVGDGEDKNLDGEQEDLVRDELCELQCGGR